MTMLERHPGADAALRTRVLPCALPPDSFLHRYADAPGYADAYVTEVAGTVSQAAFVEAFYTTGLFKIERTLLAGFAGRPSTDAQARELALGAGAAFAAWRVERRSAEQLLLADVTGRTRSWLMAVPGDAHDSPAKTRLYFGSAVVAVRSGSSSEPRMGWLFRALLGFHRLYSKLLLGAARSRLAARSE